MKHCFVLLVFTVAMISCAERLPTDPTVVKPANLPRQWPRSAALETSWGKPAGPRLTVLGVPALTYSDPENGDRYVQVSYLGQTEPQTIRSFDGTFATDGKLTVMGKTVDFYGSGNEIAEISTQPVHLAAPSGWSGWFTFTYSSKEHLKGRNLPAISW